MSYIILAFICRNGESPIKGIDTHNFAWLDLEIFGRNGESPIKGIDTDTTGTGDGKSETT